jgi:DNA-binding transcriptional regulator YiaG
MRLLPPRATGVSAVSRGLAGELPAWGNMAAWRGRRQRRRTSSAGWISFPVPGKSRYVWAVPCPMPSASGGPPFRRMAAQQLSRPPPGETPPQPCEDKHPTRNGSPHHRQGKSGAHRQKQHLTPPGNTEDDSPRISEFEMQADTGTLGHKPDPAGDGALPDRISRVRCRMQWTRAALARFLGCDEALVREWESGAARTPATVLRWLDAADIWLDAHPPPDDWRARPRQPAKIATRSA